MPIRTKSWKDPIHVHVFSDIHRAAEGCDARKLRSDIASLKARVEAGECHRWLGGGDWSNAIGPKDKRFDVSAVGKEFQSSAGDDLFGTEVRKLAEEFAPIREWGIGVAEGNHESTIARGGDFNPTIAVASRLNLPYLGYSALIRFRLSSNDDKDHTASVLFYWHHGYGAGRAKGSKMNMLYRLHEIIDADVYGCGHTHETMDFPAVKLSATRRGALRLQKRDVLYFNSGTYLKTFPTDVKPQTKQAFDEKRSLRPDYGERAGYAPTPIGHSGFVIRREHGDNWSTRLEKVQF